MLESQPNLNPNRQERYVGKQDKWGKSVGRKISLSIVKGITENFSQGGSQELIIKDQFEDEKAKKCVKYSMDIFIVAMGGFEKKGNEKKITNKREDTKMIVVKVE